MKFKNRLKNPYFWLGLLGVFATSIGVNVENLTSWQALCQAMLDYISNPSLIVASVVAILGVFIDPSTKGIKDGDKNDKVLDTK